VSGAWNGWGSVVDTPCSMSFLLDCYARAGATDRFDGYFPVDGEWLEIINETNVSGASDELVAQVARLLINHDCAGPNFFCRLMEKNYSVAWCFRLLSPVLEQMGASFGGSAWQRCAVGSPEPHLLHLLQSAGRWDPALNEPDWHHECGNVEALHMLLKQFDVDWKIYGRTALFGLNRTQRDKVAHQQVTRALLDAGADPRLLVGQFSLPSLAVLEVVFERVAPQTLFPTAADLLCPQLRADGPAIVLLLLKHGYTVDEVRRIWSIQLTCCSDEREGLPCQAAGGRYSCYIEALWLAPPLHVVRSAVPQAYQGRPACCDIQCAASHSTLHG
jgi:hypothetical protein